MYVAGSLISEPEDTEKEVFGKSLLYSNYYNNNQNNESLTPLMDEIEYSRQVLNENGLVEDSIRRCPAPKINIFTVKLTIFVLLL